MNIIFKILISFVLIFFLFNLIDIESVSKNIKKFSYLNFLFIFGMLFIQNLTLSFRWICLLKLMDIKMPFYNIISIYWSGLFFNQLMPSSFGGDLVKVIIATKTGHPFTSISTTIVLERVIGLLVFCFISLISLIFVELLIDNKLKMIIIGVPIFLISSILFVFFFSKIVIFFIPFQIVKKLINELVRGMKKLIIQKYNFLLIVLTTVISHFCMFIIIYSLFKSLIMDFDFLIVLYVMPIVFIISSLPISIAGWGVREASMVGGFLLFAINPEISTIVSIIFGLTLVIFSIPGGVMWWMLKKII